MIFPPPKPSQNKTPIWVWLDYLVKWMTSERVYIQGWKMTQKADGKHFTPPKIITPSSGWQWQTPNKELDPSVAVSKDTVVYISPGNPLVTTGLTDLILGANTTAQSGIWIAVQDVPSQTADTPPKYNVPQLPLPGANGLAPTGSPLKGDADGDNVYWVLISPVCF